MRLYENELWLADLDEVIASLPELAELDGKTVMVTGGTGLVCSPVVDILIRRNEAHGGKAGIVAAGRNEKKVMDRFGPYAEREWFRFLPFDAAAMDHRELVPCDYIIHGASNSSPDTIVKEPVETMLSNFLGVRSLLEHARKASAERVLYISTSEVYGKKAGVEPFRVGDHGYIDILNPRSSYSIGKCAAETLCASYADEYGVSSVIVRPGHIYGPTATPADRHVASAWAYAAARGEDIVMKSDGAQIRSYCYCADCAAAILKALLRGEDVHAYNISNPDSVIDIRGMAAILAGAGGVRLRMELPTESERKGFNPMLNSSLDSTELLALGWRGLFDAQRGFSHTVEILREMMR